MGYEEYTSWGTFEVKLPSREEPLQADLRISDKPPWRVAHAGAIGYLRSKSSDTVYNEREFRTVWFRIIRKVKAKAGSAQGAQS